MTVADQIVALLRRQPGLTETELAQALFPDGAHRQRINASCQALVGARRLVRQGMGGNGAPYRYHLAGGPYP